MADTPQSPAAGVLRQSALAHLGLEARAVARSDASAQRLAISEREDRAYVNLRFDAGDEEFYADVSEVIGVAPPVDAGDVAAKRGVSALWLGPDEWLVARDDPEGIEGPRLVAALQSAFGERHASAVDVSHNYACLLLTGPRAAETISRGCPLDLHPSVFPSGSVAQSILGKADVILHRVDDRPGFEILTRRSFAEYVFRYLEDAGRQFGLAVVHDQESGAEAES